MTNQNKNKIPTLTIPDEVVDSDWRDDISVDNVANSIETKNRKDNVENDIGVDYAIYGNDETREGEYISPDDVSKESIVQIKNFQEKLAFSGIKRFRQKTLMGAA